MANDVNGRGRRPGRQGPGAPGCAYEISSLGARRLTLSWPTTTPEPPAGFSWKLGSPISDAARLLVPRFDAQERANTGGYVLAVDLRPSVNRAS